MINSICKIIWEENLLEFAVKTLLVAQIPANQVS
jgi:hypothetical protein